MINVFIKINDSIEYKSLVDILDPYKNHVTIRMWPISSMIIIKTLNQEDEYHRCTPNFQAPTTQQVFPSSPNYEVGIETLVNQIFLMHKMVFFNQLKKL